MVWKKFTSFDNESPLLASVKRRMNREWKRSYLNNMQQTETRIQMIKMVNEFKLTVVHFARRCRSVVACGFTTGQKNCGKSGLGHRAAGLRAVGCGPLGSGPAFSKTPLYMDRSPAYSFYQAYAMAFFTVQFIFSIFLITFFSKIEALAWIVWVSICCMIKIVYMAV